MRLEKYITEARKDELYHVTTYKNAINILKHRYFRPSPGIVGIKGLSTTTNPNYWWGSKEVRFVLDSKKLNRKYKLKKVEEPIGVKEDEVKIVTNDIIKNIEKYIIRVEYFKNREFKSFIEDINDIVFKSL